MVKNAPIGLFFFAKCRSFSSDSVVFDSILKAFMVLLSVSNIYIFPLWGDTPLENLFEKPA